MNTYTAQILNEMVGEMRTNIDCIEGAISLSSPAVERDLQLAADCLDHAAGLLRVMQHDAHLKLFGETA